jgi:hypothetical protein
MYKKIHSNRESQILPVIVNIVETVLGKSYANELRKNTLSGNPVGRRISYIFLKMFVIN